jgi:GGDEF domain-containing protein
MSIVLVEIEAAPGARASADGAMKTIEAVRPCLRSSDTVFAYSPRELLVLLSATGPEVADTVAKRIERSLTPLAPPARRGLARRPRCGAASSPADGDSLKALIAGAKRRLGQHDLAELPG